MRDDDFDELLRVQRTTAASLRQERQMDRKVALLSIIQGLNPDRRGRILAEQIAIEARSEGFSDDDVDRLLDDLERDGYLKRVDLGIMMLV